VLPVARRLFILSVINTALVQSIQPADDIMIVTSPTLNTIILSSAQTHLGVIQFTSSIEMSMKSISA
jgi:hypothetical protein